MAVITEVRFRPDSSTSHANYSPSRNPDMNVAETTNYKGITVSQSYGGKIYTNERYGKQLEYELSYTNLSEADKTVALAAEKVALKVYTTVSTIQSSAKSSGLDAAKAFATAIEAVGEVVNIGGS